MSEAEFFAALTGSLNEPESVIPTRVIVITTADGKCELERQLFTSDPQWNGRCPWDVLRDSLTTLGHALAGRLRFGTIADV